MAWVSGRDASKAASRVTGMRPLSARAREQVAAWDGRVVPARDAATVVVTRRRSGGLEVLLLRRQPTMAFAAGMHVFPGGSVQASDREAVPWVGPDAADWALRWGCDAELARALVVAAVRESFEESGILFAGPKAGLVLGARAGDEWTAARHSLESGRVSLSAFLRERDVVLRADLLVAWAHWITPDFEPRRFDTRFLLAVLPDDEVAHSHSGESDSSFWLDVDAAVQAAERGELPMMPPTLHTLRELSASGPDGVAAVLAGTVERRFRTIRPQLVELDGQLGLSAIDDPC